MCRLYVLYEKYDNSPKSFKEANNFHYHVFSDVIDSKLNSFANKYELFIEEN